ncbi:MAG: N,N-dimethylformamidase beta subunit family domain-containing protein [Actinomycetota bacterium]|nr:hypothetical protein [Actinomycetota bacterium]
MKRVLSVFIVLLLTVGIVGGMKYAHRGNLAPAGARELAQPTSPIAAENARRGDRRWRLGSASKRGLDAFASATSVRAGDPLDVYVRTKSTSFRADVYRMGWYAGAGARLVTRRTDIAGDGQSPCDAVGKRHTVTCAWRPSFTLGTRGSWPSGVYLIKLTTPDKRGAYVPFVIRETVTRAPIIFQSSVTTWQAYNSFGGRSLYDGPCTQRIVRVKPKELPSASPAPPAAATETAVPEPNPSEEPSPEETSSPPSPLFPRISSQPEPSAQPSVAPQSTIAGVPEPAFETESTCGFPNRSRAVSFDRPYDWPGAGQFFRFEYPLLAWMESKGYDVAYATDVDLHEGLEDLKQRRVFLSVGHDEYYSTAMRDELESALAAGTSLAFFGANDIYRHIRFEDSPLGADRIEVNYKYAGEDPLFSANRSETTGQWRDRPINRPEQTLLGAQYSCNPAQGDWVPTGEPAWLFRNTGFAPGDSIDGLVGYEFDRLFIHQPHPDNVILVAKSPVRCGGKNGESNTTLYVAPSGAAVFDAGTLYFTCGVGPTRCTRRSGSRITADPRLQQLAANLIDAMLTRRFE